MGSGKTVATVTSLDTNELRINRNAKTPFYHAQITFKNAAGNQQEGSIGSITADAYHSLDVGSTVEITYLPDSPKVVLLKDYAQTRETPSPLFYLLGAAVGIAGMAMVRREKN